MDKVFGELDRKEADRKLDEFNDEWSGTTSGRMSKYVPDDHDSNPGARERRTANAKARLSQLEAILASDPAYAQLYNDTRDAVRDAQIATRQAMAAAVGRLEAAQDALSDVQDRAARLAPDGERVYRDADRHVYTEDGRRLTPDEAASVVFPDNAPRRDDYLNRKRAVENEQRIIRDIRAFEDRLGGYQNRLDDQGNPLSPGELRDIQSDVEKNLDVMQAARPKSELAHDLAA